MNGKKAKHIRRMAKQIARKMELPWVKYKEIKGRTKVRMTATGLEPYETTTTVLTPHCGRSWYQHMKKAEK